MSKAISIVGAGVAGLCVAQELVSRGLEVTVYDRQAELGPQSCSWWAGGMLAPFCEAESAEPDVVTLGQSAACWWQDCTGLVQNAGTLVLALNRDQADLVRFAQRTDAYQKVGAEHIKALEPDLAERFHSGLYYPEEAHLSPRDALAALRAGLVDAGVNFIAQEVDPEALAEKGIAVDCRGISARPQLSDLRGVKGEMLILHCPDVRLSRPIRLLHPRIPLYIVPRDDHHFMLGATMIESSAKAHVTARSVLELLSSAYALNPSFGEAEIIEIGVDSRPAFKDNLPSIHQQGNVIRANGLYRHGFLLAPSLAKMVAELVVDNKIPRWFAQ